MENWLTYLMTSAMATCLTMSIYVATNGYSKKFKIIFSISWLSHYLKHLFATIIIMLLLCAIIVYAYYEFNHICKLSISGILFYALITHCFFNSLTLTERRKKKRKSYNKKFIKHVACYHAYHSNIENNNTYKEFCHLMSQVIDTGEKSKVIEISQADINTSAKDEFETKWQLACEREKLIAKKNVDSKTKQAPEIINKTNDHFVINSLGIPILDFENSATQLSDTMGTNLYEFIKTGDSKIRVNYTDKLLPEKFGFEEVPIKLGEICFGISQNGFEFLTPKDMIHLKVAGTSGSGKSVFMSMLILQLALNFDKSAVIVVSPKAKRDFQFLSQAANVELFYDESGLMDALKIIDEERLEREITVTNPWPIFFILDEADNIVPKEAIKLLNNIFTAGRSASVHGVICSQRTTTSESNVSEKIMQNTETGICFRVKGKYDAQKCVGSERPKNILQSTRGRAFFFRKDALIEIQCPLLTEEQGVAAIKSKGDIYVPEIINKIKEIKKRPKVDV